MHIHTGITTPIKYILGTFYYRHAVQVYDKDRRVNISGLVKKNFDNCSVSLADNNYKRKAASPIL